MRLLLSLPIIIIDIIFSLSIALPLFAVIYFFKIVLPVSKELFNVMGDNNVVEGKVVDMWGEGAESTEELNDSWKAKELIGAL